MTIFEFAEGLNGRSYGKEITSLEEQRAKELGFVVVFGYSDDNTEFRGAYNEEVGCFDGGRVYEDGDKYIDAVWCKDGYSWIYNTNIPHATFDIYEDKEKFCRGIVFSLRDLYNENTCRLSKNYSKKECLYYKEWVLCEEKLPEYTNEYNVTVGVASEFGYYEKVTTLRFERIKGREPQWIIPKHEVYCVIAWMPLPLAYQKCCETCTYYDTDKNDQPCSGCFDYISYKYNKGGVEND